VRVRLGSSCDGSAVFKAQDAAFEPCLIDLVEGAAALEALKARPLRSITDLAATTEVAIGT